MALRIANIEIYLPSIVLRNDQLSKAQNFSVSEDEIFKKTGIQQRYISGQNETASDMAVMAAEKLFNENETLKGEIDFIIFCSEAFDYIAPSTACILQDRIGLRTDIGAIDLPYGCSGYLYGIGMANALLSSGMATKVLFITSDTPSKVIDESNFELRSLFSDIATANVLELEPTVENQIFEFGTNGKGHKDLIVDFSGFRNKVNNKNKELPFGEMKMNSLEIFRFGIREVPKLVNSLLIKNNKSIEEIDLFVFHQASYYLLEIIRRKIKAPKEKFYLNLENYGNSVASTIPVSLFEAEKENKLKRGMTIMLCGFGIGNSWGGTIMKY
jgi:3-oxoacyl-[acyl-carrier-protein] synthase-3